jgi:predicted esterase YcpF (UPF0227 family)
MIESQVIYIHGFGSSVNSETLKQLKCSFPTAIGLTYDHTNPADSIRNMVSEIRKYASKDVVIVGSSLGGWYTEQLTKYVVADFILYNPSTQPEKALAKYGVSQDDLLKYKSLASYTLPAASRNVILSIDDQVIDPILADVKYKNTAAMTYTAGGHRMTSEAMDIIVKKINYLRNQLP